MKARRMADDREDRDMWKVLSLYWLALHSEAFKLSIKTVQFGYLAGKLCFGEEKNYCLSNGSCKMEILGQ